MERRSSWTVRELLTAAKDFLEKKQIESPRLTAEVLLAYQLGTNRVDLYLNLEQPLKAEEISAFRALIKRRIGHEPLQYITGVQEFWSLDFAVGPDVLIPRPESELIVEIASKRLAELTARGVERPRVLDLGTGCGVLAVSLAREVRACEILATDISPSALRAARENAERHGVSERIRFRQGNLWEALEDGERVFHVIVSNPPYVASEEFAELPLEIRDFEPREALNGREGGMYFIDRLFREGSDYLTREGWMVVEMAPWQTQAALRVVEGNSAYRENRRIRDYGNQYRVVMAKKGPG